jgi:hypothetical protein
LSIVSSPEEILRLVISIIVMFYSFAQVGPPIALL